MKLGNYVELLLPTDNLHTSITFYERLGLQKLADDGLTDGCFNLRLAQTQNLLPALCYFGSDVDGIRAQFNPDKQKRKGTPPTGGEFKDTSGRLRISVNAAENPLPMPAGTATTRQPLSKLGKLAEITLPVPDLADAVLFWTKFGFEALHTAKIPHPYAIVSDNMMVLGLHQSNQPTISLTYFAPDMANRIEGLKTAGVTIRAIETGAENEVKSGSLLSPEGMVFFLLTGNF
jgi:catechol 2,3-dioxygenase-like lactoylglutathione lyase family enzyme